VWDPFVICLQARHDSNGDLRHRRRTLWSLDWTFGPVLRALLGSPFVSQSLVMFMATNKEDLVVLKELIEAKKVTRSDPST
jgi:hypothetical protein